MGRYYVDLDPSGYLYASEPGMDFELSGAKIAEKLGKYDGKAGIQTHYFWNPPGTEWLLPTPKQFNRLWYGSSQLGSYVLRQSNWTFATGLTVTEHQPTRLPSGASFPDNQWISIPAVPSSIGLIDSTSWTSFRAAMQRAGIVDPLPTSVKTLAFATQTPAGGGLNEANALPYFQFQVYPAPFDFFVCGFENIAVVFAQGGWYVLRTLTSSRSFWELLAFRSLTREVQRGLSPVDEFGDPGANITTAHSFLVAQVGPDSLHFQFDGGVFANVRLRDTSGSGSISGTVRESPLLENGPWWVAGATDQKLDFQAQVVGYHQALMTHLDRAGGKPLIFIDFGARYAPTAVVEFSADARMFGDPAGNGSDFGATADSATQYATNSYTNQELDYGLRDKDGNLWASNGSNTQVGLTLNLTPANHGGDIQASTPMLRSFKVRFLAKTTARTHALLRLNDTQFSEVRVEASLHDPAAESFVVELNDLGQRVLLNAGLDGRDYYPAHLLEDVDNDGNPQTVRGRAWVVGPDKTLLKATGPSTPTASPPGHDLPEPYLRYRLNGRRLLFRADQRWAYLPQLVKATGDPHVEHSYAIQEALRGSAFDVDDPTKVWMYPDPQAGTDVAWLPGSLQNDDPFAGEKLENPWAPDWDETRLDYMLRVARDWRGWCLYEGLDGTIYYHPDLMFELRRGKKYYRTGTIYRTHAEAVTAGYAGQSMLGQPTRQMEHPDFNFIRISGPEIDSTTPTHVIDSDARSLTDLSYDNHVGELLVVGQQRKEGVTRKAKKQLARVALLRHGRRKRFWTITVPLAPWRFGPAALYLGHVWQFGDLGDMRVVHLDVRIVKSRVSVGQEHVETRITGERLPQEAVRSETPGDYPGQGL